MSEKRKKFNLEICEEKEKYKILKKSCSSKSNNGCINNVAKEEEIEKEVEKTELDSELRGILENNDVKKINFKNCNFKKDIAIDSDIEEISSKECKFNSFFNLNKNVKTIEFLKCTFLSNNSINFSIHIEIMNFENCNFEETFKLDWFLRENEVDDIPKRVFFKECKFDKIEIGDFADRIYKKSSKYCKFELFGGNIQEFIIHNIKIDSQFYINKQSNENSLKCKIKRLIIKNSIFQDNFKLHNCEIDEALIRDTDFEGNADFLKCHFKNGIDEYEETTEYIEFKALNFRKLALFGGIIFYKKFILKYVTIEGYSHFKNAEFKNGLDLDYVNIEKNMNFFGVVGLDTKESLNETSQETYRIIKHNFVQLNNKIEANKYHSLELIKKEKKLQENKKENLEEFIIFWLHKKASKYSTSWILPLFWIFIVSVITNLFLKNYYLSSENIFQYASLLAKFEDFNCSYTIMTLNKISLGYLYYQFLTAVRKDTRK